MSKQPNNESNLGRLMMQEVFGGRDSDIYGESYQCPSALHGLVNVLGINRKELSEMMDISPSRLGHYINGVTETPFQRRYQFIRLLGDCLEKCEQMVAFLEGQSNQLPDGIEQYVDDKDLYPAAAKLIRAKVAFCRDLIKQDEATLAKIAKVG